MSALDALRTWSLQGRRPPADDAYTAWFNANSRCTLALRAWRSAARGARAAAYRAYLVELQWEEAAAGELERLESLGTAA